MLSVNERTVIFACILFEIKFKMFTIFASCRYFEKHCRPKRLRITVIEALCGKGPQQRVVVVLQ